MFAVLLGLLVGPLARGEIFRHSVPPGRSWRRECPHCTHAILRDDAVLAGVLPVTGRCPRCERRVGAPTGSVEAMSAGLAGLAATAVAVGPGPDPVAAAAFAFAALFGVVLSAVDIAVHRLPDRLTMAAFAATAMLLATASAVSSDWGRLAIALLAAFLLAVAYLLLAVLPRAGMGFGDVKLAPLVGLTSGWFGLTTAAFAAIVGLALAGLAAIALLVTRRVQWHSRIAHGPFLLAGGLIAVLAAGR